MDSKGTIESVRFNRVSVSVVVWSKRKYKSSLSPGTKKTVRNNEVQVSHSFNGAFEHYDTPDALAKTDWFLLIFLECVD